MPLLARRPVLSIEDARILLNVLSREGRLQAHAAVSLMLLAGLRFGEVRRLTVGQYEAGPEPWLDVDGRRRIPIAPSAAAAVDAWLAAAPAAADELLIDSDYGGALGHLFALMAEQNGIQATMHSLRQVAIMAAWMDGCPGSHIEAYFGIDKALDRKALVPLSDGYDAAMARTLEAAFGV
ncbi:hypothetical protein [Streptomyces goshikiensis]|uniref:hypothetical protein n=1 Tax=Streptomyces goshikiensis TaxID=1942 RepID=UPI00364D85ED